MSCTPLPKAVRPALVQQLSLMPCLVGSVKFKHSYFGTLQHRGNYQKHMPTGNQTVNIDFEEPRLNRALMYF